MTDTPEDIDPTQMGLAIELHCPPIPLPVVTDVSAEPTAKAVVMQTHTPQGVNILFYSPEDAEGVARDLVAAAREARRGGKGLLLPKEPGGIVVPGR